MKITLTGGPIDDGEYALTAVEEPVEPPDELDPPPTEPPPEPDPIPDPDPTVADSLEADGIEWSLAAPVLARQYVNGDWWVPLGTIVQAAIPGWNGERNGSMINPRYINDGNGRKQGYDKDLTSYSDAERPSFPIAMLHGVSLVSTVGWRESDADSPMTNNSMTIKRGRPICRPTLRRAAVLTCLDVPPVTGDFRPAYGGEVKRRFNVSQLIDLDTLPKWPVPSTAPSIGSVLANFDALWLDHRGQWHCQYLAPSESMPDYERNQNAEIGDLIFFLCLNIPLADKWDIAVRLCQLGIDQHAIHETTADWGKGGGGHGQGRRAPVILAGFLLGDPTMRDYFIGKGINVSLETAQVARDELGAYWRERSSGTREAPGNTNYDKNCTSATWYAAIAAMRALGLESQWAHEPSFQYQDEYADRAGSFSSAGDRGWHLWHYELYLATNGGRNAP